MRMSKPLAMAIGLSLAGNAFAARRVAVVVAISSVPSLPADTALPNVRADASALAGYLEDHGGYDRVDVLLDTVATRAALQDTFKAELASGLKPGDTLLWVFAGQGFGGDFGDPGLLLYDSRIEDEGSALSIGDFAQNLARQLPGVNLLIVTDAAHTGAASGVALLGPTAKNLATLPGSSYVLSATSPGETAPDGLFLPLLLKGMQGAADLDKDGAVTTDELHRYLINAVADASHNKVHPAEAGTYDPNLVVSLVAGKHHGKGSASLPAAPSSGGGDTTAAPFVFGGPISYSLMGAGVVVAAGFGVYGNLRGHATCDLHGGQAHCTSTDAFDRYTRIRDLTNGGYAAGAMISLAGVGLALIPLDTGGAWMGLHGRF